MINKKFKLFVSLKDAFATVFHGDNYSLLVWIALFVIFVEVAIGCIFIYPELLTFEYWSDPRLKRSEVLRNFGLMLLGAVGIYLAYKRSSIAQGQLSATEVGLDIDRLQKSIESIVSDAEYPRVVGVLTLLELARKNKLHRDKIVLALISFLQSKAKDCDASDFFLGESPEEGEYNRWLDRDRVGLDSIEAFNGLIELEFSDSDLGAGFKHAYNEINMHGAGFLVLPVRSYYYCDFSDCFLRIERGAQFYYCDLTRTSILIFDSSDAAIFHFCNVSDLTVTRHSAPLTKILTFTVTFFI